MLAGFLALNRNFSPCPKPHDDGRLVQSGVYRLIRHPLYTSLMLGFFGWALYRQSGPALLWAAILTGFLDAKARIEEAWLKQRFPEYREYQERVRRFIPFIY